MREKLARRGVARRDFLAHADLGGRALLLRSRRQRHRRQQNHPSSNPCHRTQTLLQHQHSEQAADQRLHVQQHSRLRCRHLRHAPVPQQRRRGCAQHTAGSERHPRPRRHHRDRRHPVAQRHPTISINVPSSSPYTVTTTWLCRSIKRLLSRIQNSAMRSDRTISRSPVSWPPAISPFRPLSAISAAPVVEASSAVHPTPIHPLLRKQSRADGQNHRHHPHHQRGVAHGRQRQPLKLDQELDRNAQQRRYRQQAPLLPGKARPVSPQQRQERHDREQEPVQHHERRSHLRQRDLAEEEAAPPETARQRTRRKPPPPMPPARQQRQPLRTAVTPSSGSAAPTA